MQIKINYASQFRDAFRAMDRHGNFSYDGIELLFEYLEELNPDYELDVIELCCEYTEITLSEVAESYDIDLTDLEGEDRMEAVMEYLNHHTSVVGMVNDENIIYANF